MFGILHTHSMFSLHDSTQTVEDIVRKVKDLGYFNVTLTDHGTMLGIDDFMEAGKEHGINTIPGVEAYMERKRHLILVAKDAIGFRAISHALRDANEQQEKVRSMYFPIMTDAIIQKHFAKNTHVIATSACVAGPIASILLEGYYNQKKIDKIKVELQKYETVEVEYREANKNYTAFAQEVKYLKKQKTEVGKYLKPPFLKRIQKDEDKLSKHPEDDALRLTIQRNKALVKSAGGQLTQLDEDIQTATANRVAWKKKTDGLKDKRKKILELSSKIKELQSAPSDTIYERAKAEVLKIKDIFPNFYIEVQNHGLEMEAIVMPQLVQLARETQTPLIAANDAHMTDNSQESMDARQLVRFNYFETHQTLHETDRTLYIKSEDELYQALIEVIDEAAASEAIENTSILDTCHVVFEKEKHYPKCVSEKSFFELVAEARQRKIDAGDWDEMHEASYQRELKIIPEMGYVDYHMVVYDYCNMMRKLGVIPKNDLAKIPDDFSDIDAWLAENDFRVGVGVGPGRGSAAGSLICYLLGITNIDPIKNSLLFDRYLNPERVSLPDIDTDVKTSLRPYIIRYLKWKYGERAVCSIMTKTTYAAKGSIQMAGRDRASELFGMLPKSEYDEKRKEYLHNVTTPLSNLIPEDPNATLANSGLESVIEEAKASTSKIEQEKALIWERAKLIEGKLSTTGIHAGGVVISDNEDINDYVPLGWREDKRVWAAQCDMIQIEEKGMLKMDLLGLNTLDVISDCLQLILEHKGVCIDIDKIAYEPEVFREIYAKGKTNSVFQFESEGMKSMLTRFCPDSYEDLIILVAMFRPGPLQYIDSVIDVKHGKKPLTYLTKELEPILSRTYGSIVYQEEVMQIFQSLAGYSFGQADLVRRAMSKKKEEKLKKERSAFVYGDSERDIIGCVANGIEEPIAHQLFDEMTDFAKYAFNKSHAAAYALVSYQTAWLKYHYPVEFMCAMFNNKDQAEYAPILEDCRTWNIELLPPSINHSFYLFTIEKDCIRFGFNAIKGIRENETNIVTVRSKRDTECPYVSFSDFIIRNTNPDTCTMPKKNIVANLIGAGVFDEIQEDREALLNLHKTVTLWKEKTFTTLQNRLTDAESGYLYNKKDVSLNRKMEIQLLGSIVSENPLKAYKEDAYYGCVPFSELNEGRVSIMGFVSDIADRVSKKGNPILIVELQGKSGKTNVFFMNQSRERYMRQSARFMNQVVRIDGSCRGDTVFANQMEILHAKKEPYYYLCDTPEKIEFASQVMAQRNKKDGYIPLTIMFYLNSTGEVMNTPKIKTFLVDDSVITKLKAKHAGWF